MEKQSVLEFLPQAAQSRIQSNTGRTFDVINPATGQIIASVADNGEREAQDGDGDHHLQERECAAGPS